VEVFSHSPRKKGVHPRNFTNTDGAGTDISGLLGKRIPDATASGIAKLRMRQLLFL